MVNGALGGLSLARSRPTDGAETHIADEFEKQHTALGRSGVLLRLAYLTLFPGRSCHNLSERNGAYGNLSWDRCSLLPQHRSLLKPYSLAGC